MMYCERFVLTASFIHVDIEFFSMKSPNFFVKTPMECVEKVANIDHLRSIGHGKNLIFKNVDSESSSVDTFKVSEIVKKILGKKRNGIESIKVCDIYCTSFIVGRRVA